MKNPEYPIRKIKFIVEIKNGRDYKHIECEKGYPIYGSGGKFTNGSDYLYKGESVLLGRKGTIDKPIYVNEAFWTVDTMFYTKMKSIVFPKFFFYSSLTIPFNLYSTSTALPSMSQDSLLNHKLCFPPLKTQKQIADFLDRETTRIDTLISKKQKQIGLLQEKRQAIITEAVTGKKIWDGDAWTEPAEVQDSGVEWIGEIPEGWEISRFKFYLKVQNGFAFKSDLFDSKEGYPIIRIRDITSGQIETFYKGEAIPEYIVNQGDLLIGMDGDFNIRWWEGPESLLNQRCCRILEGNKINRKFLYYVFPQQLKVINDLTYFTTVKHLSSNDILEDTCLIPPLETQKQIADFLDKETTRIDMTSGKIKKSIDLLKEYRSSLITHAVSGQIDISKYEGSK